jgi:septum formation protein
VTPPELILASASPRRAEILRTLGLRHRVIPADIQEDALASESAEEGVERLAREKAQAVASGHRGSWVLAGDTIVLRDGVLLGKPGGQEEAVAMLLSLAGRTHEVASGLALVTPEGVGSGVQVTQVRFRSFDVALARAYVATGEPMDKAGGYGIQGKGGALVEEIRGDYSGVVGLPIPLLVRLLGEAGRPYRF